MGSAARRREAARQQLNRELEAGRTLLNDGLALLHDDLLAVARAGLKEARAAHDLIETLMEFAPPEQAEAVRAAIVNARAQLDQQERALESTIGLKASN